VSALGQRIISALVLAPVVVAIIHFGGVAYVALILAAGVVCAWEWARLCGEGRVQQSGWALVASVATVLLLAFLDEFGPASWGIALATVGVAVLSGRQQEESSRWLPFGVFYLGLCFLALFWLRETPTGAVLLFWLLAVIWATDSGAFFVGRSLGGPKLAPAVSPNKTWSGLIGGALCAALVGWLFIWAAARFWDVDLPPQASALSAAILALVGQAGDLLESALKRRFGQKDASNLIPGHGGLLDRVDGLLSAGLALAAMRYFSVAA
jgi:phosphatidate cytidylyltransferase